jgi:hypothetical protein
MLDDKNNQDIKINSHSKSHISPNLRDAAKKLGVDAITILSALVPLIHPKPAPDKL